MKGEPAGFLSSLWGHSKWVLTSSGLAVAILVYEHFVHAVPATWFWPVLLVAFIWSAFRAWAHEYRARRDAESRLLGAAPQLLIEYDAPGVERHPEQLRVRNTSAVPAYNVQVVPFTRADLTATFPLRNVLPGGAAVTEEIRTNEDGPLALSRLHELVMRGRPAHDLAAWAEPVDFDMVVHYSDYAGTAFKSTTRLRYQPVIRTVEVLGVQGAARR